MATLTTQQAAGKLGVTRRRVLAMIKAGRLKGEKFGRDWMIDSADLAAVRHRKPGRPPASKA
jgi:excisionase family DNA binding protein